MANKRPKRGPEMTWFGDMDKSGELVALFNDKFFEGCRVRRSAFIKGAYRASPKVALEMVQWWKSFGVQIALCQIRPDLYGEKDQGPSSVKQSA
jgi:hypothetical protein